MSKLPALSLLAALALAPALASAQAVSCPSGTNRVTGGTPNAPVTSGGNNNFPAFISGALFCASRGSDRWQEWHKSDGALIDYKLGPETATNKVDPTTQVGTWSTIGNGNNVLVRHTYGSTSYDWAVCHVSGSTFTLVSPTAGTINNVRITTVGVPTACP